MNEFENQTVPYFSGLYKDEKNCLDLENKILSELSEEELAKRVKINKKLLENLNVITFGNNIKIKVFDSEIQETYFPHYRVYNQAYFILNNLDVINNPVRENKIETLIKNIFPYTREEIKKEDTYIYTIQKPYSEINKEYINTKHNFICNTIGDVSRSFGMDYFSKNINIRSIIIINQNFCEFLFLCLDNEYAERGFTIEIHINFLTERCSFSLNITDEEKANNLSKFNKDLTYKNIFFNIFKNIGITKNKEKIIKYFDNKYAKRIIALNSKLEQYENMKKNAFLKELNENNIPKKKVYKFPRPQFN